MAGTFKAPPLKDCKELLAASKYAKQFVVRMKETLFFKELFDEGIYELKSTQYLESGEWGGGVVFRGCLLSFKHAVRQDDVKFQIQKRLENCLGIRNGFVNIFPQTSIKHAVKKRKKEEEIVLPPLSKVSKPSSCYTCEIEARENKILAKELHSADCPKAVELIKNR